MARIVTGGIACATVFALASCGSDPTDPTGPASQQPTVTTTVTESAPQSPVPQSPPETNGTKVDPADYSHGDNYYFTSVSGKWNCGILLGDSPRAGCHGPLPSDAPKVPGSGSPDTMVAPNVVTVGSDAMTAKFYSAGDPQFYPFNTDGRPAKGRILPYDRSLTVGNITCSIAESTGVTCDNTQTGHGFTVSDSAYQLR